MIPAVIGAVFTASPKKSFDQLAAHAAGGPSTEHGFYAWWQTPGALPTVTATPHPEAQLELLNVGIAPGRPGSSGHLRKRLATHRRAAIGSSTLRFTLAAFLWRHEGWRPYWTSRPTLSPDDRLALQAWQRRHLVVQWVAVDEPWRTEAGVVRLMRPPLKRQHNAGHPAYDLVDAARNDLRVVARAAGPR